MKKFITEWKKFHTEFSWKMKLDALLGGFVFSTLIFLPIFVALGELIVVFMQWKTWLFLLIAIGASGYVFTIDRLMFQALALKKPDHESDLKTLTWFLGGTLSLVVLIFGIFFTWILLPIIWI